jgi:hypothetical protein
VRTPAKKKNREQKYTASASERAHVKDRGGRIVTC